MGETFEGDLSAQGLRFAIVVSRFNELLSRQLLEGAQDALRRHGSGDAVDVAWTPGSFEIPIIAQELAESGRYDAVICLGVVIRGATPHFDYICAEAAKGIAAAALSTRLPVAFGVVTADTIDQAVERCGTKGGNKGWQAAMSAIEMANLMKTLRGRQ